MLHGVAVTAACFTWPPAVCCCAMAHVPSDPTSVPKWGCLPHWPHVGCGIVVSSCRPSPYVFFLFPFARGPLFYCLSAVALPPSPLISLSACCTNGCCERVDHPNALYPPPFTAADDNTKNSGTELRPSVLIIAFSRRWQCVACALVHNGFSCGCLLGGKKKQV